MALSSGSNSKADAPKPIVDVAVLRTETAELKDALSKLTSRWAQVSDQVKDIRCMLQQDFSRTTLSSAKSADASLGKSVTFNPEPRGGNEKASASRDPQGLSMASNAISEAASQIWEDETAAGAAGRRSVARSGCSSTASPSSAEPRHLVINLDVNKTILMSDKVQNKNVDHIVNEILSDAAWGTEVDGQWVLSVREPTVQRPSMLADGKTEGPELASYTEWLSQAYPGSKNKKFRNTFTTTFTDVGHPGESLVPHADTLRAGLKMPDGQPVQIIPAFFELMTTLKRQKRSFTLCFRTFGEDLLAVAEELNEFCEGKHVFSPVGVVFDGSDGEPDYRITAGDTQTCGTFYRDDDEVALVWGTWWQPEKEPNPSMAYYEKMDGIIINRGSLTDAGAVVRGKCKQPGSFALRDYFLYWKAKEMTSLGGKLLFYECSGCSGVHEVFFDDNIRFTDAHIVHPIDVKHPEKKQWVTPLLQTHMCRAEPLKSIPDAQYFVRELARLEAGYSHKLKTRSNLSRLMMQSRFITRLMSPVTKSIPEEVSHDAWSKFRRSDLQLSIVAVRPEEAAVQDF